MSLQDKLRQFTGSEFWHKHWLGKMLYTDGVQYFAEHAGHGAYWFLDIVATELHPKQVKPGDFYVIKLEVAGNEAVIQIDDGDGNVFWTRHIEYTDCPPGIYKFYLVHDVLLLPSEY
jgi:hypothetical protein